ncbi:hypothetical protein H7F51_12940 [Novosphingobium flavum]|uniref:EF-hand domain-containing protein n=1 Tax=Novosphingobium flavum TaxID=1778672 RepID=A0A7X1FT11_9SPHN|nr:hypothetical protein [Novosphingobium flavum]MBC2666428.1 hypothetical protein [Novosphingobium flavum]
MNRMVLGGFAALLMVAAGLFWWQGRAAVDPGKIPAFSLAAPQEDLSLPTATGAGQKGAALPQASEQSKEQKRFDRLDRNRDGKIARVEMLAPRAAAFRKLDTDGNNLLSFEEWAVKTGNKFKGADANGDGLLDRGEFATTKPKPKVQPACKCGAKAPPPAPTPSDDDEG